MKSFFGVMGALVPIIYCGSLLYYFLDLSGSVQEAKSIGLGPTLLGLGVVGLLFFIPLIIRITRIFAGVRSPGSRGGPDVPNASDGFDADAVVARYIMKRSMDDARAASRDYGAQGSGRRTRFGRKIR